MHRPLTILAAALTLASLLGLAGPALADDPMPNDKTLGAKPPEGAKVLIGDSLAPWTKPDGKTPAEWPVVDGAVTVAKGNIQTKEKFADFQLHIEFNVPLKPDAKGQARLNCKR